MLLSLMKIRGIEDEIKCLIKVQLLFIIAHSSAKNSINLLISKAQ